MRQWHSAIGMATLVACLAAPAAKSVAAGGTAIPSASSSEQETEPGKLSLPTVGRPLIITITPEFLKALKAFKHGAKPQAPENWSPLEIAAAKARCAMVLKKIHAVVVPQSPLKAGACGAPAPVELISIGTNPEVTLSPPATVTCDLAEALSNWIEGDLQPLARKHFGANIIKIEVMSSYSCRNAYGRKKSKLSEHGLANALDIRGFVTASAKTASVLDDWGKPQREIVAEIGAARIAAEKAAAVKGEAERPSGQIASSGPGASKEIAVSTAATASSERRSTAGLATAAIAGSIPKITVAVPGARSAASDAFGFSEPNHLGGPLAESGRNIDKRQFLHEAHTAACRIFRTTLGPEANASHRNHFHVDMAKRKVDIRICD